MRAVPRAPAGDAGLADRRATAVAGLTVPPVDPELVLHRPVRPSGVAIVAQGRPPTVDARRERCRTPGGASHLVLVEARRPGGGFSRACQSAFVDVDVPEARDRTLVEQRRLEGRASTGELPAELPRAEAALERLGADPRREVRLDFGGLCSRSHVPKRRTSRYTTSEPSSSLTTARVGSSPGLPTRGAEAPRHAQVDQEQTPAPEADDQILAAALDDGDALALELRGDRVAAGTAESAASMISTRSNVRPTSTGSSAWTVSTSGSSGTGQPSASSGPRPGQATRSSTIGSARGAGLAELVDLEHALGGDAQRASSCGRAPRRAARRPRPRRRACEADDADGVVDCIVLRAPPGAELERSDADSDSAERRDVTGTAPSTVRTDGPPAARPRSGRRPARGSSARSARAPSRPRPRPRRGPPSVDVDAEVRKREQLRAARRGRAR